jgi:hypothetical protein
VDDRFTGGAGDGPAESLVDEGRRALESGRWQAAREAFEATLVTAPSADARDGLGHALWFLGQIQDGIAQRERAFEELARERRCDDAARTAVWISHQHLIGGRTSAARGWLGRAGRVLDGIPHCLGHGWIAVERARHDGDIEERHGSSSPVRWARRPPSSPTRRRARRTRLSSSSAPHARWTWPRR